MGLAFGQEIYQKSFKIDLLNLIDFVLIFERFLAKQS
jgi:hypothetical protein